MRNLLIFTVFLSLFVSCASRQKQEQNVLKHLKRGMSEKVVKQRMGMIPLVSTHQVNSSIVEKNYKNFILVFDKGYLKDWIYLGAGSVPMKFESFSKDRNFNATKKALLKPSKANPQNEYFLTENYQFIKKALRGSNIEVVDKGKHDFVIYYGAVLHEPDVEVRTESRARYNLNYVPGQSKTYNLNGTGETDYYSSGYNFANSKSTYSGTITEQSSGYFTSQYAGQDTRTYKVVNYTKEMRLLALDRKGKEVFRTSISSYGGSSDLRVFQPGFFYIMSLKNIRRNDSQDMSLHLHNTYFSDFVNTRVPTMRTTPQYRNIAGDKK